MENLENTTPYSSPNTKKSAKAPILKNITVNN